MSTRNHIILSDLQIPYHNKPLVGEFIAATKGKAASLTIIGDFMDFPGISKWSKGTVEEYTSRLEEQLAEGRRVLRGLRRAFDCPIWFHEGNHEERVAEYIRRYAPGFSDLGCLTLPELLEFKEHGVATVGAYHKIDGAFATTHGHLGRLAKTSGGTAIGHARKARIPIVCGHTHRLGIVYETSGVEQLGTRETLWGMEVGHMMDTRAVTYQKDQVLNWQPGYGIVAVNPDGKTQPFAVNLEN